MYVLVCLWYASRLIWVVSLLHNQDMSAEGHIVHTSNRKTVRQKYTITGEKNMIKANTQKEITTKLTKGLLRHDHPTRPTNPTHARIPNNNKNKKRLRHILRPIHHIPTISNPRKERLCRIRLEHGQRTPKKNLQTNKRRTKHANLYRRIPKPHLQKNNHNQPRNRTNNRSIKSPGTAINRKNIAKSKDNPLIEINKTM